MPDVLQATGKLGLMIAELEDLRIGSAITDLTSRSVSLKQVIEHPEVYQPRMVATSEKHISDLRQSLNNAGELDPILVMPCGDRMVVIDGHHRLAAYKMAKRTEIPVEFFKGTAREAIIEAGSRNSRAVLTLSNNQRQNWAWSLVRQVEDHIGFKAAFSRSAVTKSSGISKSQHDRMRQALKALGAKADGYSQWWQANEAWKAVKAGEDYNEEFTVTAMEERAQDIADRIVKAISSSPANNPEIMARALMKYLGRNAWEVTLEMRNLCRDDPAIITTSEDEEWEDEDADY